MEAELKELINSAAAAHPCLSYDKAYWGETPGRTKQVLHEFKYLNQDKIDRAFVRYLLNGIGFPKTGEAQLALAKLEEADAHNARLLLDRLIQIHKLVRL